MRDFKVNDTVVVRRSLENVASELFGLRPGKKYKVKAIRPAEFYPKGKNSPVEVQLLDNDGWYNGYWFTFH